MIGSRRLKRGEGIRRRAFSLAEMIISIALVGVMLAAALNTLGLAKQAQRTIGDRSRGMLLAQQLMTEILARDYNDPEGNDGGFGARGLEATGDRDLFNDVDDYDGWSASPPEDVDGTAIDELEGWTRKVEVKYAAPANTETDAISDLGLKRIVVTVMRGDQVVATLTALRSGVTPIHDGGFDLFGVLRLL
jgi:prepilin-type N-terminal cleavage/methylation domain-containing protein